MMHIVEMDLFSSKLPRDIIKADGDVIYYGKILNHHDANKYLNALLKNIEWKHDEAIIFGKHIITKRKAAWYGDEEYRYTYSNTTKQALNWTQELFELKVLVEELTKVKFNSCLLNLYNSGDEGMSWHSDDEKALGTNTVIASLSLGAERKFAFKHKLNKDVISIILEHGSLLIMKGSTQSNWLHSLPKTKKVTSPRINLTFRTIVSS